MTRDPTLRRTDTRHNANYIGYDTQKRWCMPIKAHERTGNEVVMHDRWMEPTSMAPTCVRS